MICLGNLAQIDTPYLAPTSSGLTYMTERLKDFPHGGALQLKRCSTFASRGLCRRVFVILGTEPTHVGSLSFLKSLSSVHVNPAK